MASRRKTSAGNWEFTIKRAGVLEKPIYLTFPDEEEGERFCANVEALLDKGIVPTEYQVQQKVVNLEGLIAEYTRNAHPSEKDLAALNPIISRRGRTTLTAMDAAWVDEWIAEMKRIENLAPATIRARVGALARCTDWGMRKKYLTMPDHPLRTLPDGYAQYSAADADAVDEIREDIERDRRLEPGHGGTPGEHERIMAVLEAGVLPRKSGGRRLEHVRALRCLYVLALESAMRLREMFTLTVDQVDIGRRTVFLEKTKNGDKRQVPLSSVAAAELRDYLEQRAIPTGHPPQALFPWWNGSTDSRGLKRISQDLGKTFHNTRSPGIFEAAGCVDLRFHDLRHEATSRLFERTTLSETEIMKITGHKSHRMIMRYANLRASNLAAKLW